MERHEEGADEVWEVVVGLLSCGKNQSILEWDSKLLNGSTWLISLKGHSCWLLFGTDCWGQRWDLGVQKGAVVIFQNRNDGDLATEELTVGRWEVVGFCINSDSRGFRICWVRRCKGKRGVKDDSKIFGLSTWKNTVALYLEGEEEWMLLERTSEGDLDLCL